MVSLCIFLQSWGKGLRKYNLFFLIFTLWISFHETVKLYERISDTITVFHKNYRWSAKAQSLVSSLLRKLFAFCHLATKAVFAVLVFIFISSFFAQRGKLFFFSANFVGLQLCSEPLLRTLREHWFHRCFWNEPDGDPGEGMDTEACEGTDRVPLFLRNFEVHLSLRAFFYLRYSRKNVTYFFVFLNLILAISSLHIIGNNWPVCVILQIVNHCDKIFNFITF